METGWLKDLSIIIAAVVAIYGITAWRRQLLGSKRVELAEKLLASFYEARDIITAARSPASYGGEGATRKKHPLETEDLTSTLNSYWASAERLLSKGEFFATLEALQYRAMAYFGSDVARSFTVLRGARNRVIIAAQMLVTYDRAGGQSVPPDLYKEWTNIIWQMLPEDDAIDRDLKAVLATIEQLCRPTLTNSELTFVGEWCTAASRVLNKVWRSR